MDSTERMFGESSSQQSRRNNREPVDAVYEVEKIVKTCVIKGKLLFLVKWKGWDKETNTWEPRENLTHCEDLLRRFVSKVKKKEYKQKRLMRMQKVLLRNFQEKPAGGVSIEMKALNGNRMNKKKPVKFRSKPRSSSPARMSAKSRECHQLDVEEGEEHQPHGKEPHGMVLDEADFDRESLDTDSRGTERESEDNGISHKDEPNEQHSTESAADCIVRDSKENKHVDGQSGSQENKDQACMVMEPQENGNRQAEEKKEGDKKENLAQKKPLKSGSSHLRKSEAGVSHACRESLSKEQEDLTKVVTDGNKTYTMSYVNGRFMLKRESLDKKVNKEVKREVNTQVKRGRGRPRKSENIGGLAAKKTTGREKIQPGDPQAHTEVAGAVSYPYRNQQLKLKKFDIKALRSLQTLLEYQQKIQTGMSIPGETAGNSSSVSEESEGDQSHPMGTLFMRIKKDFDETVIVKEKFNIGDGCRSNTATEKREKAASHRHKKHKNDHEEIAKLELHRPKESMKSEKPILSKKEETTSIRKPLDTGHTKKFDKSLITKEMLNVGDRCWSKVATEKLEKAVNNRPKTHENRHTEIAKKFERLRLAQKTKSQTCALTKKEDSDGSCRKLSGGGHNNRNETGDEDGRSTDRKAFVKVAPGKPDNPKDKKQQKNLFKLNHSGGKDNMNDKTKGFRESVASSETKLIKTDGPCEKGRGVTTSAQAAIRTGMGRGVRLEEKWEGLERKEGNIKEKGKLGKKSFQDEFRMKATGDQKAIPAGRVKVGVGHKPHRPGEIRKEITQNCKVGTKNDNSASTGKEIARHVTNSNFLPIEFVKIGRKVRKVLQERKKCSPVAAKDARFDKKVGIKTGEKVEMRKANGEKGRDTSNREDNSDMKTHKVETKKEATKATFCTNPSNTTQPVGSGNAIKREQEAIVEQGKGSSGCQSPSNVEKLKTSDGIKVQERKEPVPTTIKKDELDGATAEWNECKDETVETSEASKRKTSEAVSEEEPLSKKQATTEQRENWKTFLTDLASAEPSTESEGESEEAPPQVSQEGNSNWKVFLAQLAEGQHPLGGNGETNGSVGIISPSSVQSPNKQGTQSPLKSPRPPNDLLEKLKEFLSRGVTVSNLSVLMEFVKTHDPECTLEVCRALIKFMDNSDSKINLVIKLGYCPLLIKLLKSPSLSVVSASLQVVSHIVSGNHYHTQAILECSPLPFFKDFLSRDMYGPSIRKEACLALSNITAGTSQQIQHLVNEELFPALLNCMQYDEDKVRYEATWAVANATVNGTTGQVKYIVDQGFFRAFCGIMRSEDEVMVQIALDSISNVLKMANHQDQGQGPAVRQPNPYCREFIDLGGVPLLKHVEFYCRSSLKKKAYDLLCSYFLQESYNESS